MIWAEDRRQVQFLLEYDTGSENLSMLAGKLDGYQVLAEALAWNDQMCPVALICFASPRREQSARRALAATPDAPALRIATAALNPRLICPAGPVWLPLLSRAGRQVRLADLDDAVPDPWLRYRQEEAHKCREVAERERTRYRGDLDDEDSGTGLRGITLHSPLNCPGCGHQFKGTWVPGGTTADQTCPSCGNVFTATWPGWGLEPEQTTPRAATPYRRPHLPPTA